MSRKPVSLNIIKSLLANSGNKCAFPGCNHIIVNEDHKLVGELCHIEAYSPNGARYNPRHTIEERNSYDNLVFLCHKHHNETHDLKYTVAVLKKMKLEHEGNYSENPYTIDMSIFYKIMSQNTEYWNEVAYINEFENQLVEQKYEINTELSQTELIESIREDLNSLEILTVMLQNSDLTISTDIIDFLNENKLSSIKDDDKEEVQNLFSNRNWEIHNIGVSNWMLSISMKLMQLEIKCMQNELLLNPSNKLLKHKIQKLEDELKEIAKTIGIVD
ncbi:MAG: hypothetical protein JXM74_01735 [Fusobacteriaceae bacterium]|nr:hypothetical protein [Fusobacteriaceae bacterium]MBN2837455.1 hypothetical protein [Fusobacteriaceae bacterium]